MYLCTAHEKGISSLQLGRDLNLTQKTAWFVLHRIREMFSDNAPELLEGIVEVDETYVGGKNKSGHAMRKPKRVDANEQPLSFEAFTFRGVPPSP